MEFKTDVNNKVSHKHREEISKLKSRKLGSIVDELVGTKENSDSKQKNLYEFMIFVSAVEENASLSDSILGVTDDFVWLENRYPDLRTSMKRLSHQKLLIKNEDLQAGALTHCLRI